MSETLLWFRHIALERLLQNSFFCSRILFKAACIITDLHEQRQRGCWLAPIASVMMYLLHDRAPKINKGTRMIFFSHLKQRIILLLFLKDSPTVMFWFPNKEAQWPIGYGVGFRIKRSSVRIRPWPLRWVLGQGSLLPLSQGEAFTLASISYLAILVKYILAKKKKKKKKQVLKSGRGGLLSN